jgi:UDP-glucose 4-epimerase
MNKALITGGLGFIGYHLSARLLAEGYVVHAFDNAQRGKIDSEIDTLKANHRYRLIVGDLINEICLEQIGHDYTHIFHLAAIVGVKNVIDKPYNVLKENTLALLNVINTARRQKNLVRFVFPSTSEVYAGTLQYFGLRIPTPEYVPLTITDVGQPRTSYMLSKIYGEALCRQSGVPFTIIRPHNVYGPRMGMAHVIPELLERAHSCPDGGTLLVYSAHHKRTFCYVDDAVELIVKIASSPEGTNQTFNIGSADPETSIGTLAQMIIETVGKDLKIEPGPETSGSPARRRPDVSFVTSVAHYAPMVSLPKGLHRTYDWYCTRWFKAADLTFPR